MPGDISGRQKEMNAVSEPNKTQRRAIPLRTIITVAILVGVIVSSFLLYFMYQTAKSYEAMREATSNYIDCQTAAADLKTDSEYLTNQARSFVVTGDASHVTLYYEEVQTGSFLEELREYLVSARASRQLETAMQLRDRLMITEGYAMRLMVAALGDDITAYPDKLQTIQLLPDDMLMSAAEKQEKARQMLFDNDYEASRNEINSRLNKGLDILMSDMLTEQVKSSEHLQTVLSRQQLLTGALILSLLLLGLFIVVMVIQPLQRQIASMGSDQMLSEEGTSEIRFLAHTYNRMYEQNQRVNEKLNYEATHDGLTGLYNRAAYDSIRAELSHGEENNALILLDVDLFKRINDQFGHDVGDKVLKTVAQTLLSAFRKEDDVCRIGGDEFAVIMRNLDSGSYTSVLDKMQLIAERLAHPAQAGIPPVTLSVGVAFTDQLQEGTELFKSADLALYHIKETGRNGCGFFTSSGNVDVFRGEDRKPETDGKE